MGDAGEGGLTQSPLIEIGAFAAVVAAVSRRPFLGPVFLGPAHADVRLDQPVDRRIRESLDEAVDHRLLEDRGGVDRLIGADLEHDLVVQPRVGPLSMPALNSRLST